MFDGRLITSEDFFTEFNRRVFVFIESAYSSNDTSLETMNEFFTPEEVGRITRMKINRMSLSASDDSVLEESIESLRRSIQKKEAGKTSTFEALDAILQRKRNG